jgi:hypothetical protein
MPRYKEVYRGLAVVKWRAGKVYRGKGGLAMYTEALRGLARYTEAHGGLARYTEAQIGRAGRI